MSRTLLKIGEFARLAKISIKQLRRFHDLGVLRAHSVAHGNGYRYYSMEQLRDLHRLQVYRTLGFTLSELRRLMAKERSTADLRDMLGQCRTRLAALIETERARLVEVEARIAQLELPGDGACHDVAIRRIEPMHGISLRRECDTYDDVDELLQRLRSSLPARASIRASGAIWHRCHGASRSLDCEAVVFADVAPLRQSGVQQVVFAACTLASVLHAAGTDDSAAAYQAAMTHAAALGYRRAGPMREIYLGTSLIEAQFPLTTHPTGAS
jgi:DNA-binding transcriptional MerR regulator